MPADQQPVTEKARRMQVDLGERPEIASVYDEAIRQTLQDAMDGGDGPLVMLEKPVFDRSRRISRPDVKHSVLLRLMYFRP